MIQREEFQIKVFQEVDGSYYAQVGNLPGCFTTGETLPELEINLKEAISSYLGSLQKDLLHRKFRLSPEAITYA